jgi:outer membrane lipoprotein-sorting protein
MSTQLRTLLAVAVAGGLAGSFAATEIRAQGQTEVQKTMPAPAQPEAAPQPAPAAPAEEAQQPAPADPAASPQQAGEPASPIGSGANWQTDTATAGPDGEPQADASAIDVILKVNDYFNGLTSLQGSFLQTDPDNKQKRGKFYFERPGKVRFDYALPSKLIVVSDGDYLAIEDHDLKTTDRYPLRMTPFRMLLAEKVDLMAEARILGVDQGPEAVVLTVEDKASDTAGRIRLFFSAGDMVLQQWIITDPQGLDTRVQLADLQTNEQLPADLFKFSRNLGFRNLSQ